MLIFAGAVGAAFNLINRLAEQLGVDEQGALWSTKGLVDGAPSPIKEGASKDEAEDFKKQLEEAGASVEVK